jgi:hypothetical protein
MNNFDRTKCCGWVIGTTLALLSAVTTAETMTKPAAGVTRIVFNTPGELIVKPGTDEKLVVEAEPKVLALLDISVKGDTIVLASKGQWKTDKGVTYTLGVKSFRALKTEASGNTAVDGFAGGDADVELGGSGNIGLKNLKFGRLAIVIKGSGNVEASGSGKTVTARIDGSGTIDTANYAAQVVEAKVDGSGSIKVHADESLKAAIGGAGTIAYKGKAKVTQTITGAGNVERI